MPFLMLGEALVDLICEQAAEGIGDARAFTPHFGGAAANVAVSAARAGGRPALAGGAGQDPWGQWLLERLREEGVDTRWFALDQSRQTPIAFATVAAGGEPTFAIYGEGISAALVAFGGRADEAVEASEALVFASNTLVGPERGVTLRARDRARELGRELGRPICFDPNLRLERWPSAEAAVEAARGCLEGCLLVKANANEARLLTGERDPAAAADALAAGGVELVVITFFGTPLAGLQAAGWNAADPGLRDTLGAAAEAGARATESWGAVA